MAAHENSSRTVRPAVHRSVLREVRTVLERAEPAERALRLREQGAVARREGRREAAALLLLAADLQAQGWEVKVGSRDLTLRPPPARPAEGESIQAVKERQRAGLLAARAAQLADPSVRAFLREMEQRRPHRGRRRSVLDLVDNGEDLYAALTGVLEAQVEERPGALASIIAPEVEVADAGLRCSETGLELQDIWRYFRHTWSLEYRPTPGRTLLLLLRNAARPGRPVMAIAALASALPQLRLREEWVGWTLPAMQHRLSQSPTGWPAQREALLRTLELALSEVRTDDLLKDLGSAEASEVEEHLLRLSSTAEAERQRVLRTRRAQGQRGRDSDAGYRLPVLADGSVDWLAASEHPLFVRKRARLLSELLFARRLLAELGTDFGSVQSELARRPELVRALTIALREVRKAGLSSRLLDVSVCGAVPPYGPLLAGKLAALAVASAEVAGVYQARYGSKTSEIASQLAGRQVIRPADICALTTTSLYAVSSSQYNRLRLEVELEGTRTRLCWEELGLTEGFGTAHLGEGVVQALREVAVARRGVRLINNRFGEGISPRMRQVREGLEALGIPGDAILEHSSPRRVYAMELSPLGRHSLRLNVPHSARLIPISAIIDAWRRRWLLMRISNTDVLAETRRQGPQSVLERLADRQSPQLPLL